MTPEFLRRRNALWAKLRSLPPGSPEFETVLGDLAQLIGWDRPRILAGLGLNEPDSEPDAPPGERP
ncbi:hypothetical protein [Deinococcus sp. PESE-13]